MRWVLLIAVATALLVASLRGAFAHPTSAYEAQQAVFIRVTSLVAAPGAWVCGLWMMATGSGKAPCAWARFKDGETLIARPWGRMGSRRWRIIARGDVTLEKARDRRVPTAHNVWVFCGVRRLPLLCPGPFSDASVEELATWLRLHGSTVTVTGNFDKEYEGPRFFTAKA